MYGESDADQHAHRRRPAALGRAGWCEATQFPRSLNGSDVLHSLHAMISAKAVQPICLVGWHITSPLAPGPDRNDGSTESPRMVMKCSSNSMPA